MPKTWFDRGAAWSAEYATEEQRQLNMRIVADKKPYFMRYIYPSLMRQYNTYISNTNKKCLREFRITMDELLAKPADTLSEEERTFIHYYHVMMPVGVNDCVMNRICRRFEAEFDGYIARNISGTHFDYTIMKRGVEYSKGNRNAIEALYRDYTAQMQEYMQYSKRERISDPYDAVEMRLALIRRFSAECDAICSCQEELCDIVLDMCYQKERSKQFAWDIAGGDIFKNLLMKNNWIVKLPVRDHDGEVVYNGERFSFVDTYIGGELDEHSA